MRDVARRSSRCGGWAAASVALVGLCLLGADSVTPTPAPSPSAPLLRRAVSTYAGSGKESSTDGPLLSATFSDVDAIAADPDRHSLYVADKNEIRELTKDGAVVTVAGALAAGSADGRGGNARFNMPQSIAYDTVDKALYICDYNNFEIRRMTADGDVTTVAGSPVEGRQDGTGPDARFSHPGGIAFDSKDGAFYVSDTTNNAIRRVTSAGVVSTVAGAREGFADGIGASARFHSPWGIAYDAADGDLYVSDPGNFRIRRVTPAGSVTTYSGYSRIGSAKGPVSIATWGVPAGIAWDQVDGSLYVVDELFSTVRRISAEGVVSNVAGNGSRGHLDGIFEGAEFSRPSGIAVDPMTGYLFVADFGNNLVRMIQ